MDRWQAWLGTAKHFPRLPGAPRHHHQLRRLRPRRPPRSRNRGPPPGDPDALRQEFRRLGPAHRRAVAAGRQDIPLGDVRPRAAADLDQGTADPARRRRASDAAASRPGRQPVDRGRHCAGGRSCSAPTAPLSRRPLLAYERLRREAGRPGAAWRPPRTACATTSAYSDPRRPATPSSPRMRRSAKRLYDFDVVPDAEKAAMALGLGRLITFFVILRSTERIARLRNQCLLLCCG